MRTILLVVFAGIGLFVSVEAITAKKKCETCIFTIMYLKVVSYTDLPRDKQERMVCDYLEKDVGDPERESLCRDLVDELSRNDQYDDVVASDLDKQEALKYCNEQLSERYCPGFYFP
ncbi:hypothetical protein Y032_0113g372 [Ancylostoma ceylanicum]|uniref:Saposin B-type domain-containing protein n=1 Tax=Ancylostoma ceylanicum TaxID=53326 RepID=A0A016TDG6_9BILA|nr:hypothetical protein Y032_0113g372 [Ancylostoma ceylanicum]